MPCQRAEHIIAYPPGTAITKFVYKTGVDYTQNEKQLPFDLAQD
jgi:hypothetical protein